MSADDQREQRYGEHWTLDELAELAAGTGSRPDYMRTPLRKHAAQKAFPDLIAAARERNQLRVKVEQAREFAKGLHRARCGDEFTVGYCYGCDLTSRLDGQP